MLKTSGPVQASIDSRLESEESHVRACVEGDDGTKGSGSGAHRIGTPEDEGGARHRDHETVTERTARIDQKLTVATMVLKGLSPTDARARLLHSAILRRDEVLLDAVLAQMTEEVVALVSSRSR